MRVRLYGIQDAIIGTPDLVIPLKPSRPIALHLSVIHHAQDMPHARPCHHGFLPKVEVGVFGRVPVFQNGRNPRVPNDKGEVRVCAFTAIKPVIVDKMVIEPINAVLDFAVGAFIFVPGHRWEIVG